MDRIYRIEDEANGFDISNLKSEFLILLILSIHVNLIFVLIAAWEEL